MVKNAQIDWVRVATAGAVTLYLALFWGSAIAIFVPM